MANWKNAPLVYTIGMLQFPRVPGIERFADGFLDRIRRRYPLSEMVSTPIISANFGPDGMQVTKQDSRMWQYLSIEKTWGFVLDDQSLYLHTIQYHDFADFAERFKEGLTALLGIPEIGISWVTALGIRYVDMVVASEHKLQEYLQPWILPTEPPDSPLTVVEGAYVARYSTELGDMRLQSIRNPPFTLPPELQSPLIAKNQWAKVRPESEFALVDTDHGVIYTSPKEIDVDEIVSTLDKLHLMSKKVFESMGTPMAVQLWRDEK